MHAVANAVRLPLASIIVGIPRASQSETPDGRTQRARRSGAWIVRSRRAWYARSGRRGGRKRQMKRVLAVAALCGLIGVARAQDRIVLDEVVGSWQGDDQLQYVELRMLAGGQSAVGNVAGLIFDDKTASADGRRVFAFTHDVTRGLEGAKIL